MYFRLETQSECNSGNYEIRFIIQLIADALCFFTPSLALLGLGDGGQNGGWQEAS